MQNFYCKQTAIGKITILESHGKITNLLFDNRIVENNFIEKETNILKTAFYLLEKFFEGKIFSFQQLPLEPNGTDFQK